MEKTVRFSTPAAALQNIGLRYLDNSHGKEKIPNVLVRLLIRTGYHQQRYVSYGKHKVRLLIRTGYHQQRYVSQGNTRYASSLGQVTTSNVTSHRETQGTPPH